MKKEEFLKRIEAARDYIGDNGYGFVCNALEHVGLPFWIFYNMCKEDHMEEAGVKNNYDTGVLFGNNDKENAPRRVEALEQFRDEILRTKEYEKWTTTKSMDEEDEIPF